MSNLLIFGPGYTAQRIAAHAQQRGWSVARIGRAAIDDRDLVAAAISAASHILSSVPPDSDADAVLDRHADLLAAAPARWIGYLSSTGVYGDSHGAWVDESATVAGRRQTRNAADREWGALHREIRIFRLPGIYGPGRSAFERVREGKAVRIDLPEQIFSRIHVEDIARAVEASWDRGPPGIYNIADDLPAPQNDVIELAARLLGSPVPPLVSLESARLSPMARAFYDENRRVANGKARRQLGWRPLYPTYREGLAALLPRVHNATTMPTNASAAPLAAIGDQT